MTCQNCAVSKNVSDLLDDVITHPNAGTPTTDYVKAVTEAHHEPRSVAMFVSSLMPSFPPPLSSAYPAAKDHNQPFVQPAPTASVSSGEAVSSSSSRLHVHFIFAHPQYLHIFSVLVHHGEGGERRREEERGGGLNALRLLALHCPPESTSSVVGMRNEGFALRAHHHGPVVTQTDSRVAEIRVS
ncbi:hypothetical protein C0Q70_08923 [Pomacea canaliculata]|uniref:Uncharacterized protein n=1 Tax=Pomacea canaliculata TaxID=400727 RepID=A0A2T7P8C5_POMCA|nr:hypothetical protein C0Q70_08923 [Pomacea canaliculata]